MLATLPLFPPLEPRPRTTQLRNGPRWISSHAPSTEESGFNYFTRFEAIGSRKNLPDPIHTAHVGTQRFRDDNAAVFLLIVFKHGNQGSTYGEPRTVQSVNENRFTLRFFAIANLRSARLKVFKVRTGANFSIGGLAR